MHSVAFSLPYISTIKHTIYCTCTCTLTSRSACTCTQALYMYCTIENTGGHFVWPFFWAQSYDFFSRMKKIGDSCATMPMAFYINSFDIQKCTCTCITCTCTCISSILIIILLANTLCMYVHVYWVHVSHYTHTYSYCAVTNLS